MENTTKRGISIIAGSIISVIFVSLIDYIFELNDNALMMTLVAMTSSANAIGIYISLDKKTTKISSH